MTHAHRTFLFSLLVSIPAAALADQPPVISEIVVEAPASAIWSAYTEREEVEAWMVGSSSEVELEVGGQWLTSYDENSELDDETVIRNEILAFDPERMLATRTVKPPADFPFPNAILKTWAVLYLEPIDDTRTRVTHHMLGFGDDEESKGMRDFFEWGNQYELDKLGEYLQQKPE